MPALVFLGYRWGISSDDFVFPTLAELLLQVPWIGVLVACYIVNQSKLGCDTGDNIKLFYFGTLFLDCIYFITTVAVIWMSMRGTITNSQPRRRMWLILLIKVLVYLTELVWICLSTYWIFGNELTCDTTTVWVARGALIWSWFVRFLKFVWNVTVFSPWTKYEPVSEFPRDLGRSAIRVAGLGPQAISLWEQSVKRLFCCYSDHHDNHEAFKELGAIAAEYFNLDLVLSDIVAGLVLVMKRQMDDEGSLQEVRILNPMRNPSFRASAESRDLPRPKEWMTISNMAYYMRYAIAAYGSVTYVGRNPCCGTCRICCKSRCCMNTGPFVVNVFHDDRCQSNTEALKNWTNLTDDDLIYISFRNKNRDTPFFVAVDHSKNAVVVAVRGTWFSRDSQDVLDDDESGYGRIMDVTGVYNAYCHTALLDKAYFVLDRLNNMEILEAAFGKLNADAKLVITGHGLGSGVAAVLSIILREQYPQLMCYAFSPMGACVSPNLSKYTQQFICSPTLGADMIVRTTLATFSKLRLSLVQALLQIDMPKYQIMAKGWLRYLYCCCLLQSSAEYDRQLLSARLGPLYTEEEPLVQVCGLAETLQEAETEARNSGIIVWPLKPPGQLLHIVETDESTGCCTCSPAHHAYWTGAGTFDKIIMSSSMITDHMPGKLLHALEKMRDSEVEPI
ncbi:hypothetical protein EGW08_002150 [Elysia chlorotica]|uniref:sn-1-specific diacylglycerol lipase n=1 Tax=Elysia chlorotica TaxID=188477 RepID=A0A433U8I4_ELYCH|nr:hypothetical protein EGW08_002150 [Elysia chlorotica]